MELTGVASAGGRGGGWRQAGSGHSRLPLVLALTSVSFFMVALDALVVVTALPAIHHSIGGSIATLEWAVNAYGLTFAAGIITAAAYTWPAWCCSPWRPPRARWPRPRAG